MAEISASMVMDLRQRTGLGMMECKKALTEAAGDLAKAEELLRIKSGAKASKAAEPHRGGRRDRPVRRARREDGGDGRGQLRDRLRREERRLPRVRGRDRADHRARRSGRCRGARRASRWPPARPSRRAVRRSCRRSARTCRSAASRASVAAGRIASYVHGGRIGVLVDLTGGAGDARQGSRDARRREQAGGRVAATACRPTSSSGARDRRRAGRRIGQAGEHRREDGRGRGRQVPRRGHAARPAVRQGRRQADGRRTR